MDGCNGSTVGIEGGREGDVRRWKRVLVCVWVIQKMMMSFAVNDVSLASMTSANQTILLGSS